MINVSEHLVQRKYMQEYMFNTQFLGRFNAVIWSQMFSLSFAPKISTAYLNDL